MSKKCFDIWKIQLSQLNILPKIAASYASLPQTTMFLAFLIIIFIVWHARGPDLEEAFDAWKEAGPGYSYSCNNSNDQRMA